MNERKLAIKALIIAGKLALLALLVWAIRATLVGAFEQLKQYEWHVKWPWLVLAGVFYTLGTLPSAIFWHWVLRGAEQNVSVSESMRAFYVSQMGKYVPGKAMVLVLRAGLLRRSGVETTVVAATVFYETLAGMAAGALLATLILLFHINDHPRELLAAAGMFAAVSIPLLPPVFKLVIRILQIGKLNPTVADKLARLSPRLIAGGWLIIIVGWWLQGLSLWATLRGLEATFDGPLVNLPMHTAAVALAIVAGFLAMIPAGLGVRELVFIPLLAPLYGDVLALVAPIILRLVSLVAEVVVSSILYMVGGRPFEPVVPLGSTDTVSQTVDWARGS